MTLLTEKQLEVAARTFCHLEGKDPDESLPHGAEPDSRGFVSDVLLYSPRWRLVAVHIQQQNRINHAIEQALETDGQPVRDKRRPHGPEDNDKPTS